MALPVVVGGLLTSLEGLRKLSDNPIMAWLLSLGILLLDASVGTAIGGQGAFGFALSWIFTQLAGFDIVITSFQLMIFVALTPIIIFVLQKSAQR